MLGRGNRELRRIARELADRETAMLTQPVRTDARGGGGGGGDRSTIRVRNDSAVDLPQYSIVGLDVATPLPSADEAAFLSGWTMSGVFPLVPNHTGKFAILAGDIKAGEVGRARVTGIALCKVQVTGTNQVNLRYADVMLSSAALQCQVRGAAEILWKESGTGIKWAIVRFVCTPRHAFPVTLTQVGGVQGTAVTGATWTYRVVDPETNATLIAVANPIASPHRYVRPAPGITLRASAGLASVDGNGQIFLTWINEVPGQVKC